VIREQLTQWRDALLAGTPAERRARLLVLLAISFGLALRVSNYWLRPPTLWQDEAYWAVKTLTTAAIDAQIRPLGFMLVTQGALHLFGAAAQVFRILPFVGSLLSLLLVPYVVARLFRAPWARVLAAVLLATNPVAIEMAVEFKHYGTEVGVFMAVLAALLRYLERRSPRSLLLLLAVAWGSFFFSITVIFSYPALFAFLGWDALKQRRWRRLLGVAATALACLLTIGTIYFTTWRGISANKAEQKWGTWYDVFYLPHGLKTKFDSRAAWTAAKYFELASVPGVGREIWRPPPVPAATFERLKSADRVLWSALHVAGLVLLARRRRWPELALLWTPLLFVTAFNLAGRWPAGAFRTNTFYVPYAILIASMASEWFLELRAEAARRFAGPCFAALLLLPTLYFRPGLTEKGLWGKPGAFTEALRLLPQRPAKRPQRLLMDFASCRPWEYYAAHDQPFLAQRPQIRRDYSPVCRRRYKDIMAEFQRLVRSQPRGFAALMTDDRKFESIERAARRSCKSLEQHWVHGRTHLLVICRNDG
jgi:uncharacterized membrane protein